MYQIASSCGAWEARLTRSGWSTSSWGLEGPEGGRKNTFNKSSGTTEGYPPPLQTPRLARDGLPGGGGGDGHQVTVSRGGVT